MSSANTESFVATVSIHRRTSNMEDDIVGIEVTDETSRCKLLDLEIDMETFGNLISGRGHLQCKGSLNVRGCQLMNCTKEHKTLRLPYEGTSSYEENGKALARKIVAEHEVDGWHGYDSDLTNHHHHGKDGLASVHFHRHVRPDGTPVLD